MAYPDALAALRAAADAAGLDPRIERPATDAARAALFPVLGPGLLREVAAHGYPAGLEIPWLAEELSLYPLGEVAARQAGYRWDARTGAPDPGWDPRLHVVADALADPVALLPDGGLWAAHHGEGRWTFRPVARDLPEFLETLAAWLRFFVVERGRKAFDADFNLLPDARAAILSEILASLSPDCRAGFAEVLLDLDPSDAP